MSKNKILKTLCISNLYTIYCFDVAAIVIVYIVFTPLLVKTSGPFLPPDVSLSSRNLLLGFLFAAYPLTQFFGAPILGDLSDHFGRKLILILSTFFTAITFFLTALSISMGHLSLLFISRILGGFFAGNASLAQAAVSGLVPIKKRPSYMALFTVVGGLSWIIGPLLGSFFSNPNIVSWFQPSIPFWFLGLYFLLSLGVLIMTMDRDAPRGDLQKLSIVQTFKNLASIFHVRIIVLPIITSGLAIFGWMIWESFLSPYLMEKYFYHEHTLGYVFAYGSFFWLIGGLFALYWFKRHPTAKLNLICLFIIPFFLAAFAVVVSKDAIWWLIPVPMILMSISMASFTALFSLLVDENMQGKIFGAYLGITALAAALAPALSGWISKFNLDFPFILAALTILIAYALTHVWFLKNQSHLLKKGA